MGWICLAGSEVSLSHYPNGCVPWPTVKTTSTHKQCSYLVCLPQNWLLRQSGTTFELSPDYICQTSILFTGASHAKISALRALITAWRESEAGFFSRCFGSSTTSLRSLSSSKMCQLLGPAARNEFAKNWPHVGMIVDGNLFPLKRSARHTEEKDGFSSLPTPTAVTYGTNRGGQAGRTGRVRPSLEQIARRWNPTPCASEGAKGGPGRKYGDGSPTLSSMAISRGQKRFLNPRFVECLMGFPDGWTALELWAMQWFQVKHEKRLKD